MTKRSGILFISMIFFGGWCVYVFAWDVPDTGQTTCYDGAGDIISCPSPGQAFYGQNGNFTMHPLSYTKLDANGNTLEASAVSWVMVKDNVTGLVWEKKQNKDGIINYDDPHDADNYYTWYDPNPETNGGDSGTSGDGTDMKDFIDALNNASFGQYSDWRMPSMSELGSIVDYGKYNPAIITTYFPNTKSNCYSTTYTCLGQPDMTHCMSFLRGGTSSTDKSAYQYVRAVRGEQ